MCVRARFKGKREGGGEGGLKFHRAFCLREAAFEQHRQHLGRLRDASVKADDDVGNRGCKERGEDAQAEWV